MSPDVRSNDKICEPGNFNKAMKQRILYIFTRTPLHVGAGSSVGAEASAVVADDAALIREEGLGFFSPKEYRAAGAQAIVDRLSHDVYITIDLDNFDPSEMSAVGTPEPGGLHWDEVSDLLAAVAQQKRIVGFDVTELSPSLGPRSCAQLAAKLTYRLIGLALQRETPMGGRV